MTPSGKTKPRRPKIKIYLSPDAVRQILAGEMTLDEALAASSSRDG